MKRLILFITVLTVSLAVNGKVLADGSTETFKEKAGVTPDNSILYTIDKAIDNVKINISIGENKAKVLVEVAEERLGESEVMAEKEKTELTNKSLNEYNNKMNDAMDKLQEAGEKTSIDNEESSEDLNHIKDLEKNITERQGKSIEVLQNLQNKLPDKAKETIALVIQMQTAKREAIIAVAQERQALIESKIAIKDAEKSLELAKKSGSQQEINTAEGVLKEKQEALSMQKEKLTQAVAAKKEIMKGGVGQLKKQLKAEVKNGTVTKEESREVVKAVKDIKADSEAVSSEGLKVDDSTVVNPNPSSNSENKATTKKNQLEVKVEKEDKDKSKEIKKEKKEELKELKKELKDKGKHED